MAAMRKFGFKVEETFGIEYWNQIDGTTYSNKHIIDCTIHGNGLLGVPNYTWNIGLVLNDVSMVTNVLVQVWNRSLILP